MHLKVFLKLKKPKKLSLRGNYIKKTKKPKKNAKNPLGWVLKKKPGFSNPEPWAAIFWEAAPAAACDYGDSPAAEPPHWVRRQAWASAAAAAEDDLAGLLASGKRPAAHHYRYFPHSPAADTAAGVDDERERRRRFGETRRQTEGE